MILNLFTYLIVLAIFTAATTMFFQKCIQPDMIFSWYGDWLYSIKDIKNSYIDKYINNSSILKANARAANNLEEVSRLKLLINKGDIPKTVIPFKIRFLFWLAHPIGLCKYCNGTWIAIISYLVLFGFYQPYFVPFKGYIIITNIIILIIYLGINYIFIEIFSLLISFTNNYGKQD